MSQRYFYTDNRRSNFSGTESPTFDDSEVNIYEEDKWPERSVSTASDV